MNPDTAHTAGATGGRQASEAGAVLDPRTVLDHVHLTVHDLEPELAFYQDVLGMRVHRREPGFAALGAGRHDLLRLTERPDAPRQPRASGLYHFALLVPERVDLAQLLRRISETGAPVQGLVDHHFSEAIYLPDAEGNGVELNWDRPRQAWPPVDTVIRRGNGPLDVEGLQALLAGTPQPWAGLPPGSSIGHIHLHVGDLQAAERFYVGILGFERRMAFPGQAVFVSAGGYHHHVAFNIWAGRAIPPAPPDAAGLRHFAIRLADEAELTRVLDRVRAAGLAVEDTPDGSLVRDPAGIAVVLSTP
ncbi:MAG TPA: VOC family protein [Chloroflexota bacterium]|jgi:catechol 2,3-dioxygenase|nr:VOC family protein [Chloroflexota bacterium]